MALVETKCSLPSIGKPFKPEKSRPITLNSQFRKNLKNLKQNENTIGSSQGFIQIKNFNKSEPLKDFPVIPQKNVKCQETNDIHVNNGLEKKISDEPSKPVLFASHKISIRNPLRSLDRDIKDEKLQEKPIVEDQTETKKLKKKKKKKLTTLKDMVPLNLEGEKQRFFESGYAINPQFEYNISDLNQKFVQPHTAYLKIAESILDQCMLEYGDDEKYL